LFYSLTDCLLVNADLADGVEIQVLGLIWGIMLKFLKFGDDAEALNAKDALLLWVQNKTASYANIKVDNFKKSFKDGLALCAIIHKHRPNLVDYDSLAPVCLFSFSTRIVIVVVVVVVVIVAVVVVIVVGGGKSLLFP
jgi:hypothetical protein